MAQARASFAMLVKKMRCRYRPMASLRLAIFLMPGPAGKRPAESTQREIDEATFAKQLARELYRRAHHGDYEALVLIADRQTLGQIRPILHKEVKDRLVSEIGKVLVRATIKDIQKVLL